MLVIKSCICFTALSAVSSACVAGERGEIFVGC